MALARWYLQLLLALAVVRCRSEWLARGAEHSAIYGGAGPGAFRTMPSLVLEPGMQSRSGCVCLLSALHENETCLTNGILEE